MFIIIIFLGITITFIHITLYILMGWGLMLHIWWVTLLHPMRMLHILMDSWGGTLLLHITNLMD